MRSPRLLLIAVISVLGGPGLALAHALPKTEDPPPGATVTTALTVVSLTFTETIEPQFSGIAVENAKGQRVDDGDNTSEPNDAAQLRVGLKQPVAAGTYTVVWHVVSSDGHRTHDSYKFSVAR